MDPIDLTLLRASAMPRAFLCAGSVRRSAVRINAANDAAYAGTATHEVLRTLPSTNRIDWDAIPAIAQRYGADADDTRLLVALGAKLWNQVRDSFGGAMTEVPLSYEIAPGITLTGHADLLAVSQRELRVGDWKSGRKDSDHSHQFKAYGAMALLASDGIESATTTGLWIRDQEVENYTLDRQGAREWLDRVCREIVQWDGVYRPGDHCQYCPRSHECEAWNALVRRDVAAIADKSLVVRAEAEIESMTADEIVEVLRKADLVRRYAERVREAVKAHVRKHGDVVANGCRLTIETSNRRKLVPLQAWPLLEKLGFQDADFAAAMDLKISRVEKLVAQKAGKGNGAAAVRELTKMLAQAGAVTVEQSESLEERRA